MQKTRTNSFILISFFILLKLTGPLLVRNRPRMIKKNLPPVFFCVILVRVRVSLLFVFFLIKEAKPAGVVRTF